MQAATELGSAIDFDEWAALARRDPGAFEERRLALIESYLKQFSCNDQRRLRGIQFRIDMERRRARTPLAGCIRISAMMWDSLMGPHGLKEALDRFIFHSAPPVPARRSYYEARILPFRKARA